MDLRANVCFTLQLCTLDCQHTENCAHLSVLMNICSLQPLPLHTFCLQQYVPELDRIVLKDSASLRPFANTTTCRKTAITTRILSLVHELCTKRIHVTKRDLFYTDAKLFEVGVRPTAQ